MKTVQKMKNETTAEIVAEKVIEKYGRNLSGGLLEEYCCDMYAEVCGMSGSQVFSELDYDNISDAIGFYQDKTEDFPKL
jgi:hypothetical protein